MTHVHTAIPTIFVHGTEDKNVPFIQSINLAKSLQHDHIRTVVVPVEGVGHLITGRSLKLALERVVNFFQQQ